MMSGTIDNVSEHNKSCAIQPRTWGNNSNIVFGEPWHARIFSMTVALNEAGLFTWKEWVDVFSRYRASSVEAGKPDNVGTYYDDWLKALEELADQRTLASLGDQNQYQQAWQRAAVRTRHGMPIELLEQDFHQ